MEEEKDAAALMDNKAREGRQNASSKDDGDEKTYVPK